MHSPPGRANVGSLVEGAVVGIVVATKYRPALWRKTTSWLACDHGRDSYKPLTFSLEPEFLFGIF